MRIGDARSLAGHNDVAPEGDGRPQAHGIAVKRHNHGHRNIDEGVNDARPGLAKAHALSRIALQFHDLVEVAAG